MVTADYFYLDWVCLGDFFAILGWKFAGITGHCTHNLRTKFSVWCNLPHGNHFLTNFSLGISHGSKMCSNLTRKPRKYYFHGSWYKKVDWGLSSKFRGHQGRAVKDTWLGIKIKGCGFKCRPFSTPDCKIIKKAPPVRVIVIWCDLSNSSLESKLYWIIILGNSYFYYWPFFVGQQLSLRDGFQKHKNSLTSSSRTLSMAAVM